MVLAILPQFVHVVLRRVSQVLDVGLFLRLLLILQTLVLSIDLTQPLGSQPFFALNALLLVIL